MTSGVGYKRETGSAFLDIPFALWILILGIFMPLICFATIGLRYTFFMNAANQAAHAASHAKSFEQDFPPNMSSQTIAREIAQKACQAFAGIKLNSVTTYIVITPVAAGSSPSQQASKLSTPADEENNLYQIQVRLSGEINPFIPLPTGVFGYKIPGLTNPYPVDLFAKEPSENTQGLNL
ncbi:MAG TPA: hypothetical protein V6C72_13375 [Chroococcales cyanobacterium]